MDAWILMFPIGSPISQSNDVDLLVHLKLGLHPPDFTDRLVNMVQRNYGSVMYALW